MTTATSPPGQTFLTVGDAQPAVSVIDKPTNKAEPATTNSGGQQGTHSEGYTGAFEGPEKLLEIWFSSKPRGKGLRDVPQNVWQGMLDLVHCQILSKLTNPHVDSYLLSESSLFVYPHKLILKTCGTTTLLYAIPRILEIASGYLEKKNQGVYQLFYSRKNFMFPDQQCGLHRSWEKEVEYLDSHFAEGSAYMIGKTNRDHWHVYMCGPSQQEMEMEMEEKEDTTVEILMTGLNPENMQSMYLGGSVSELEGSEGGKAVEQATGIAGIYPNALTDSFLFSPCGFSLNGLQDDGYFTIHVTPEPHCSYASFETNVSGDADIDLQSPMGIKKLVERVARVFDPKLMTVTVFKSKDAKAEVGPQAFAPVDGYKSVDRILYDFDDYWLRYGYYRKH